MTDTANIHSRISTRYGQKNLLDAIAEGLEKQGKPIHTVNLDDLAAVDEFHIGGRRASAAFFDELDITRSDNLLDLGCGLGGTCRFVVDRFDCRVSGIDQDRQYIETANAINKWVGLADKIDLHHGNAITLPFHSESFDGVYMFHVGMNIAAKSALMREVSRVLRAGGWFGIYDLMKTGEGEIDFPVPWAENPETSFVASADEYKSALKECGFSALRERNQRNFAVRFFREMQEKRAAMKSAPPLGVYILMGESAQRKIKNIAKGIAAGAVAPVEIIARKSGDLRLEDIA